jgi:integrase
MAETQVIDLARFIEPQPPGKRRPFGSIWRRPDSPHLWVRFRYMQRAVCENTALPDTPENEQNLRLFLGKVSEAIKAGTFRFADAFPGASQEKKELFSRLEGWQFGEHPKDILFGEYVDRWMPQFLQSESSAHKRRDYPKHMRLYIRPYFAEMPFVGINGVAAKRFVQQLQRRDGAPLAGSTMRNILTVFRAVWDDACEEHGWDLSDPLEYVKRKNRKAQLIPRKRGTSPEAFRPGEYFALLDALEPFYRPHAEIMVLTGMIASEIAGFRRIDDLRDLLIVQNSIVRGDAQTPLVEKTALKTEYRRREIPVTVAIRRVMDEATARAKGDYLLTMTSGIPFDGDNFRKNAWTRAFKRAGIPYRKLYALRHTFAAWSLIAGVHPERLVRLMGHGSKQMVYEVYGKYMEGLEMDRDRIREYLGEDFR